ncbi:MAG: hypothetical protein M3N53_08795 [Actinomycetota bacterium]|nr:hypothetical protein [Actinomycetota bacterium]
MGIRWDPMRFVKTPVCKACGTTDRRAIVSVLAFAVAVGVATGTLWSPKATIVVLAGSAVIGGFLGWVGKRRLRNLEDQPFVSEPPPDARRAIALLILAIVVILLVVAVEASVVESQR